MVGLLINNPTKFKQLLRRVKVLNASLESEEDELCVVVVVFDVLNTKVGTVKDFAHSLESILSVDVVLSPSLPEKMKISALDITTANIIALEEWADENQFMFTLSSSTDSIDIGTKTIGYPGSWHNYHIPSLEVDKDVVTVLEF